MSHSDEEWRAGPSPHDYPEDVELGLVDEPCDVCGAPFEECECEICDVCGGLLGDCNCEEGAE